MPPLIPLHVVAEVIVMVCGVGRGSGNVMLECRRLCRAFAYGDCVRYLLRNIEFVFDGDMIESSNIPNFWLKNFGFLQSVIFADCEEGIGEFLDVISHSPSIRHLHSLQIWYSSISYREQSSVVFQNAPNEACEAWQKRRITQEQLTCFISKCNSLHHLKLECCSNIKSLDFVSGSNVRNLSLSMCDNLTSLSGISGDGGSKLHTLHLFSCGNLASESLRDLRGSRLHVLGIGDCAKITNVDGLFYIGDKVDGPSEFPLSSGRDFAWSFAPEIHTLWLAGQLISDEMLDKTTATIHEVHYEGCRTSGMSGRRWGYRGCNRNIMERLKGAARSLRP